MRDEYGNFIDKDGNPVKWDKYDNTYYDNNGNAVTDSSNLMPNPKAEIAKEILEIYFNGGRFKKVEDQNGNKYLKRLDDNDPETENIYPLKNVIRIFMLCTLLYTMTNGMALRTFILTLYLLERDM